VSVSRSVAGSVGDPTGPPLRFALIRRRDVTGVSGTGIVAWGVRFSDGRCVLRWAVGQDRSTVLHDSIEAIERIHGHDGATLVCWLDV
jgi:hypothetical protein